MERKGWYTMEVTATITVLHINKKVVLRGTSDDWYVLEEPDQLKGVTHPIASNIF